MQLQVARGSGNQPRPIYDVFAVENATRARDESDAGVEVHVPDGLLHGVVQVDCTAGLRHCSAVQCKSRGSITAAQGIEGEEAAGRAVEHRKKQWAWWAYV